MERPVGDLAGIAAVGGFFASGTSLVGEGAAGGILAEDGSHCGGMDRRVSARVEVTLYADELGQLGLTSQHKWS